MTSNKQFEITERENKLSIAPGYGFIIEPLTADEIMQRTDDAKWRCTLTYKGDKMIIVNYGSNIYKMALHAAEKVAIANSINS